MESDEKRPHHGVGRGGDPVGPSTSGYLSVSGNEVSLAASPSTIEIRTVSHRFLAPPPKKKIIIDRSHGGPDKKGVGEDDEENDEEGEAGGDHGGAVARQ